MIFKKHILRLPVSHPSTSLPFLPILYDMVIDISEKVSEKSNFIWKIADLLRGDYKQSEYGDVILPFTVLRRLDSVLEPTKEAVLKKNETLPYKNKAPFFKSITGYNFYNISRFTFTALKNDANNIADNLRDYIRGFSDNAREILEAFELYAQIERLDKANLLYRVVSRFAEDIDLHPDRVSNTEMGYVFEELIRKFSEISNETAGEHFTPREVIRLMVDLLFTPDMEEICKPSFIAKLYDPAVGTGGMLSTAIEYARELNENAIIEVYGEEINEKTYAVCKSDTMIKGKGYENIYFGNSLTEDKLESEQFQYMLCNPPFGVDWKKYGSFIRDEHEEKGESGRFGAGLPRVSDGSLLFLQHMIHKMLPPKKGGSRIAIIFNGSPLFTGDAGSGESDIRKWIIEAGLLESIIALPDQLFYNTGILTYIWILTNRKISKRKGKIQLIDGTSFFERMRKALGNKRKTLNVEHIEALTNIYGTFIENEYSKICDEDDFAYWKVTVERPLRLNFQTTEERLALLWEQPAFVKISENRKKQTKEAQKEKSEGEKLQTGILAALRTIDGQTVYKNKKDFAKALTHAFQTAKLTIKPPVVKAILTALGEKDTTADICLDSKGLPEADPDLRDTEYIPVKKDIRAYMEQEVLPYAPDAWIDESKTKKGYEIPFTRYFYRYEPVGNADQTLTEIQSLNTRIQDGMRCLFEGSAH